MLTRKQAVDALVAEVRKAFDYSGLTSQEVFPDVIPHAELPWPTPPLVCNWKLGRLKLQSCLDVPLPVSQKDLMQYWQKTLEQRSVPGTRRKAWHRLPKVDEGSIALRFSQPEGHALGDEDFALRLALEVAHTALHSLPVLRKIEDERNFYVVCWDDTKFGVKDGKPLLGSGVWPKAYDPALLYAWRGSNKPTLAGDHLAYLRSAVKLYGHLFKEAKAVDMALLILRVLTKKKPCPLILELPVHTPEPTYRMKQRQQAVKEALDVVEGGIRRDDHKMQMLFDILVPTHLSRQEWREEICPYLPNKTPKSYTYDWGVVQLKLNQMKREIS